MDNGSETETAMNVLLTDIYAAFRDSVRFYPRQELKCQQLQTWRVLQKSMAVEISTPNLGATICDKDKPFFWSRLWHEKGYNPNSIVWEFPLLYAFETDESIMINRFGGDSKIVSSVEVGVIDVLVDDKDGRKCVGCNSRTINEIHRHSETMLLSALRYVDNTRGYSVDGGAPVWANSDFIAQGIAAQRFDAVPVAPSILTASQSMNREAVTYRAEYSSLHVYGTSARLRFVVNSCPETDWNLTETDFGVLAQEAGCKTC